jgi:hypothetical protein
MQVQAHDEYREMGENARGVYDELLQYADDKLDKKNK